MKRWFNDFTEPRHRYRTFLKRQQLERHRQDKNSDSSKSI